jgi:phosphonate transport system ATP-binding protein
MTAALARTLTVAEPWPVPAQAPPHPVEVRGSEAGFGYSDAAPVFSGVSFAVRRGETVALIGRNGAGKSTLLRCCLGFIRPTAGRIELFGHAPSDLAAGPMRQLRSQIGFVMQKHNLVPRLSALSNVVHGCLGTQPGPRQWIQALAPPGVRRRAMQALDRVGLADIALRRADRLSGGQSQRVAIARALMAEPRLLVADEPAASLDPVAGEEVMTTFATVARDSGATLLFTTHNLKHALAYADRVIGLKNGALALDAPTTRLSVDELHALFG